MASKNIKYAVFILLVIFLFTLLLVFIANMGFFMQNILWIALLLLFIFLVWKYDFILMLKDYERAVIMRFGRVVRVGGPGWCFVIPSIEDPTLVDLRTQMIDVPKQDVITKENIELKIDAVLYLHVKDDKQSVINSVIAVENYKESIKFYLISTVRAVIGGLTLPEVIANAEALETRLQEEVAKICKGWGIDIVSVDFKDVDIPKTVLDAMHEEKAAIQRKLARMESAEAHRAEIEAVRQAAENLSDKALAYYYIRALEKLGEGKSTKFIFPLELSRLAEAIGGGRSSTDVEELFKKYAPAITGVLGKKEDQAKRKIKK